MNTCTSEIYRGYNSEDIDFIKSYCLDSPKIFKDFYTDGFGVKTSFECIPFMDPYNLDIDRLKLPVPDDGFHAETIEYFALLDSLERSKNAGEYISVELGAGWGPWITTGGVIARKNKIPKIILIGVEGHGGRYKLLKKHLSNNNFSPIKLKGEIDILEYDQRSYIFNGVVWVNDGEVYFPQDNIVDMGTSASSDNENIDYRGHKIEIHPTPCLTLPTICQGLKIVNFLHIDIQGAEFKILNKNVEWLNNTVRTLMVATHSRVIEGYLIELLLKNNWALSREKPCRVDWQSTQGDLEGWTTKDGSQYWINQSYN
jgi:FkbM family methyltransferase